MQKASITINRISLEIKEKFQNICDSEGLTTKEMFIKIIENFGNTDNSSKISELENNISELNHLVEQYQEKENMEISELKQQLTEKTLAPNQLVLNLSPSILNFLREDQEHIYKRTGKKYPIEQIVFLPYYNAIKQGTTDQLVKVRGDAAMKHAQKTYDFFNEPRTAPPAADSAAEQTQKEINKEYIQQYEQENPADFL